MVLFQFQSRSNSRAATSGFTSTAALCLVCQVTKLTNPSCACGSCWCSASFKTSRLDSSNYPNVFWAVGRLHGASELQSKTSQRDWCPLWPHSTGTLQSADHYVVGWNDSWRRQLRLPLCQIPWPFNGFQGFKCCTKGFNPLSDQGQGQLVLPKNTRGNPMTCRSLMSSLDDLTSAWKYQIPVPCRVEKMPKFCCSHQTSPKTCTFVRKTMGLRRWVEKSDLQPWSNLRNPHLGLKAESHDV